MWLAALLGALVRAADRVLTLGLSSSQTNYPVLSPAAIVLTAGVMGKPMSEHAGVAILTPIALCWFACASIATQWLESDYCIAVAGRCYR